MSFVPGTHFYRQKTKYTKPAAQLVLTTTLQVHLRDETFDNLCGHAARSSLEQQTTRVERTLLFVWDYVTGKGEAVKNKYAGLPDHQHPTFTITNPMTNAQIASPQGVIPWVVKLPLPFIEGMYPSHTSHLDPTQIHCHLPPQCYFVFRNLTHCLLDHSVHTFRQGRIQKVLPHGVTHLSSEHSTYRWYPAYVLLYSHLYSTYFSLTSALNNAYVSSSAIVCVISALAVISYDFAGQPSCASSYLYFTHFSLIHTLYALSMLSSASFFVSSPATV